MGIRPRLTVAYLLTTFCQHGPPRSGKYASQLEKEGFTHVQNMKGSLISWVCHPSCKVQGHAVTSHSPSVL